MFTIKRLNIFNQNYKKNIILFLKISSYAIELITFVQ